MNIITKNNFYFCTWGDSFLMNSVLHGGEGRSIDAFCCCRKNLSARFLFLSQESEMMVWWLSTPKQNFKTCRRAKTSFFFAQKTWPRFKCSSSCNVELRDMILQWRSSLRRRTLTSFLAKYFRQDEAFRHGFISTQRKLTFFLFHTTDKQKVSSLLFSDERKMSSLQFFRC